MKNVRVFAENRELETGFNVYLDFSGQREYVMTHRHNGLMYQILKDGISLEELKRIKPHQHLVKQGFHYTGNVSSKSERQIMHLIRVLEEYVEEVEECNESIA